MKRLGFVLLLSLVCATYAIQAIGQTAFSAAGVIESSTGGFKFPDGSVQTSAASSSSGCVAITFVPVVINAAGVYCFTGNLSTASTTGSAIFISADNVTIDMNGWTLDGLGGGTATLAMGISSFNSSNITIRNGTIQGFYHGIYLNGEQPYSDHGGHLIEEIRADTNRFSGIIIEGSESIIRRNQVINTGGSTVEQAVSSTGIFLKGPGMHVLNNGINNTTSSGGSISAGLVFDGGFGSVADSNRISYVYSSLTGNALGIYLINSNHVLVKGNTVTSTYFAIYFSNSTGKYMDNLTSNVSNPFLGGTVVGTNN
jgi:parallel beta-helix repeat protein